MSEVALHLGELRSRSEAKRLRAASSLRLCVEAEAREMSSETFSRFMNELNRRIFDLVSSAESHEKQGGIQAIEELIDVQQVRA